jgi:hypothetical protein
MLLTLFFRGGVDDTEGAEMILLLTFSGGVAFDKNEGVVKRHLFAAMPSSTAWISERWRTEALKLSR